MRQTTIKAPHKRSFDAGTWKNYPAYPHHQQPYPVENTAAAQCLVAKQSEQPSLQFLLKIILMPLLVFYYLFKFPEVIYAADAGSAELGLVSTGPTMLTVEENKTCEDPSTQTSVTIVDELKSQSAYDLKQSTSPGNTSIKPCSHLILQEGSLLNLGEGNQPSDTFSVVTVELRPQL